MKRRQTITVITGTRAEFGLLLPVMRAIRAHPRLQLRTLVTGLHWVTETWRDIEAAGIDIDARVPMQKAGEQGALADALATGYGITGIAAALASLKPDMVLVLGDRIEAFAGAAATCIGGQRLGHLHGGDRAQGVADEAMRHAISKMAHLHFCATAQSRRRLIRMGELPQRVIQVGSPAIDGLAQIPPATVLPQGIDGQFIMVMQHPIGRSDAEEYRDMLATLKATAHIDRLVLSPNHDPGCRGIRQAIREMDITPIDHLPRDRFVSLLKRCRVLVGNSSAGLIEAAAARRGGVPTVNIGPRQSGREKPAHVIDCHYGVRAVRQAVNQALHHPPRLRQHPYGKGDTGQRIGAYLGQCDLRQLPQAKRNAY